MTVSDNIKRIRGDLSQSAFGKSIGAHPSVVQAWEAGRAVPGGEYLSRIYSQYNVNINWLLTGEGEPYCGENQKISNKSLEVADPNEFKMSEMVTKTVEILESDTIYRVALAHNINAFHHAMGSSAEIDKRFFALEQQLNELKKENAIMKKTVEMMQSDGEEEPLVDRRAAV